MSFDIDISLDSEDTEEIDLLPFILIQVKGSDEDGSALGLKAGYLSLQDISYILEVMKENVDLLIENGEDYAE